MMAKEKINKEVVVVFYGDYKKMVNFFDRLVNAAVVIEENKNGDFVIIKNRYSSSGNIVTGKELTLFMLRASP